VQQKFGYSIKLRQASR